MRKLLSVSLALLLLLSIAGCAAKAPEPVYYAVRYELNGGTLVSGDLMQTVKEGGRATPPVVEREGYVFDHWDSTSVNIISDKVIVAQWSRRYTVRFDAGEGTLVGEAEQYLAPGEMPVEPEVSLEGYTFEGWKPALSAASADVTYTAQWKQDGPVAMSSEEVFRAISPSVVEICVYDRNGDAFARGSGFFVDDRGQIATNYHVMEGAYSATATLSDGTELQITAVNGCDADLDLALVQTSLTGNPYLEQETAVTTGETVYALGSPRGLTGTFSDGIVSTASRFDDGVEYVQTTAPISPGNSGGPLVNVYGKVIGVNTFYVNDSQNLNFAVKVSQLALLDTSASLSIYEFGRATSHEAELSHPDEGFYPSFDNAENESNDTANLSDLLREGEWTAAELSSYEDYDWYYFEVTGSGTVLFEVAPYKLGDTDKYLCAAVRLNGSDLEVAAYLSACTGDDAISFTEELAAYVDVEPGYYFLMVTADTSASGASYPLYYAVSVSGQ